MDPGAGLFAFVLRLLDLDPPVILDLGFCGLETPVLHLLNFDDLELLGLRVERRVVADRGDCIVEAALRNLECGARFVLGLFLLVGPRRSDTTTTLSART